MAEENVALAEALGRYAPAPNAVSGSWSYDLRLNADKWSEWLTSSSYEVPEAQAVWTEDEVTAALQTALRGIKSSVEKHGWHRFPDAAYLGKIRDENMDVMVQVLEVVDTVSGILSDAINGIKPLSVACRERKMDYVRFRRFCEKFLQVRDGGRPAAVKLPDYEPTFDEKLYAKVFGVSVEGARSIMPDDAEETVEEIMASLDDKYRDILVRRINGETLESIGAAYEISRERIRQIEAKVMRKLHNPARVRLLTMGRAAAADMENGLREDLERVARQRVIIEEDERRLKEEEAAMWRSKPIEELEPTVRSYNCLKRAGIDTVGDLVEWDSASLKQLRNFGRKSFVEIEDKLHAIGLTLRDERKR